MFRAQCSLLFYDEKLYKEFINPMKVSKDLNNIIIKCLSAYYYNAKARELIDGFEDDSDDLEQTRQQQQELINNMRQGLMMQDFLAQEIENTMADGMEDISDIIDNVNNKAEEAGVATKHTTDTGETILRIGMIPKQETPEAQPQQQSAPQSTSTTQVPDILLTLMERMLERSGDKEGVELLHKLMPTQQPVNVEQTPTPVVQQPVQVQQATVEVQPNPEVATTQQVEVEEVVEDSTDLLNELLQGIL